MLSFEQYKALRQQGKTREEIQEMINSGGNDSFGAFAVKDVLGGTNPNQQTEGFTRNLFQSTIGSKGLAGAAQLPGRTIVSAMTAGADRGAAQSNEQLAKITTDLIRKVNTMPDSDSRKAQLLQTIKENQGVLQRGKAESENLNQAQITPQQAMGTTLNAASTLATGARPVTAFGRILLGGTIGGLAGTGSALNENKSASEVAARGLVGGATGLAVSGALEGLGSALKFLSQSKNMQQRTGATYSKELQPPVKEVAQDIQRGWQTFGEQVADVVDDTGRPVYTGGYKTLLSKSRNEISTQGKKLTSKLKVWDSANPRTIIRREEVAGNIKKVMQDYYGQLKPSQIKAIDFEISRMPKLMSIEQVEAAKRMFDNIIPESFWSKLEDPNLAFPSLIKYTLRDNARRLINEKTGDAGIQALNNRLSVAMDVRQLSAAQLAKRNIQKVSDISGPNPFSYMLRKLWDDVIFNPAITTRTAQGMRRLGTKTGQTPLRQVGRSATIRALNP